MKVGVPTETAAGERRVALVPDSTKRLAEAGVEVLVERRVVGPTATATAVVPAARRERGDQQSQGHQAGTVLDPH